MKNKLDEQYINLLKDILENGKQKSDRTGTGTLSVFGRTIRHNMQDGFPILTTKRVHFKSVVTELLWFLRGDTSIEYLLKNDCNIWTGDAYKAYLKECERLEQLRPFTKDEFVEKIKTDKNFANRFGNLGRIYGAQWRNWGSEGIDQISELIKLLKESPDSRRMVVNAWNVSDLPHQVLPPCHYGFQVYTRELSDEERLDWMKNNKSNVILLMRVPNVEFSMDEFFRPYGVPKRAISLMWNQRSVDTPLGLPFNLVSYGLLLHIIGRMVNMIPDELTTSLGDVHIYLNQMDGINEQLSREPYDLPLLKISDELNFNGSIDDFLDSCNRDDFSLEGYVSHPPIKIPLSN